ncbi:MAG: DUF4476 domain-containing protein [Flavisolibacter sp.]
MKNIIFTLLLGGAMSVSAYASDVTVTFSGNKNYTVVIDGRSISANGYYGNTVNLNNLRPGQHSIQVYKASKKWNGNNNTVYSSNFILRPQYDLFITVDRKGKLQMNERMNNDYGRNNGNWGNDRRDDRHNGYDRHDDDYGRDNGGYNNGKWNNGGYNNGYNQAMNGSEFNQLVSRIRGQLFASGKLNTARDAVSRNYFSTAQVRQLLQLFNSDNDKLDLAKQAYRNTVDQESYYALYDVFSYQGSRDDLDRYIRGYRN